VRARTKLTRDQIGDEARRFGLSQHDLEELTTQTVGDEINIVQEESWSSVDEATIRVSIPGKPGEMAGTVRLRESGGVTTETVDLTIKVNIPLVGGKIEGLIGDLLLKALRAENTVGRDYLTR